MAKVKVDLSENSLDISGDEECLISMVDEETFGNSEDQSHLLPRTYIEVNEEDTSPYRFRELSGAVTYKIVQMTGESPNSIAGHSPSSGPLYVLPDVFSTTAQSKGVKKENNKESAPRISRAIAKKRDDKRRATHNEVERRRRDKINNWITMLASLIPNTTVVDNASKGGILAKACDYIRELTGKQNRFEKLEEENDKLVQEILRLNQELAELRRENVSLRNQYTDSKVLDHRQKFQKS